MVSTQRYAPLPNPQTDVDAEREMDDAFDDDDHDNHGETTPLTLHQLRSPVSAGQLPFRGSSHPATNAYDFERDYDYPPPGSPPSVSALALPNNFGNSNGQLPTSPVVRAPPQSIFRRAFGCLASAVLPAYPQRPPERRRNRTTTPAPSVSVVTDNGDVYMVPEETQQEAPPSYVAASADAAPFLLGHHGPCPICSRSQRRHAHRRAARRASVVVFAGLALTLIQFGFGTTVMSAFAPPSPDDISSPGAGGEDGSSQASDEFPHWGGMVGANSTADGDGHEWISFLLMTIGWFLLLTSMIGYFRVKRFEMSVRASRNGGPPALTAEDIRRDMALRRNIEEVFGLSVVYESDGTAATCCCGSANANRVQPGGLPRSSIEMRLENDLRAAGLL
ncbi:metal homeostatis protein bsd2 [Lactarius indigo]|nr:metal homeostatis protein bsd2 [Lactarius indigo]